MVGQRIAVEIEGTGPGAALARVAAVLENPRAVMDEIGRYLVAATSQRFAVARAPDGTPWLRSARAAAEGGPTLTRTGRLRDSITHTVSEGGHAVAVGSGVAYAAIHQFGGQAGKGRRATIPARPFLGIDEGDRDAILRIVSRAIEGAGSALPRASGAT